MLKPLILPKCRKSAAKVPLTCPGKNLTHQLGLIEEHGRRRIFAFGNAHEERLAQTRSETEDTHQEMHGIKIRIGKIPSIEAYLTRNQQDVKTQIEQTDEQEKEKSTQKVDAKKNTKQKPVVFASSNDEKPLTFALGETPSKGFSSRSMGWGTGIRTPIN